MISCQKSLFNLPPDLHYLNCAYMSPLPAIVEEAGIEAIRAKRDPSLIAPHDFFETVARVKSQFAELIHADSADSISLIPSVSYGIAIAARNLEVERGQNIVLLHEQFPSNFYTWKRLADEKGLELRVVGKNLNEMFTSEGRCRAWNEAVIDAIDKDTVAVALPIVHWTDGTLFDVVSISQKTRQHGAALILDGTQSVGALPFDVGQVKPDALVVAGYKWMFGPYSTGFAWWGERFLGGVPIEENWINRLGSEDFAGLVDFEAQYQVGAARFDVGEKSNFALLPMLEAAVSQILQWTPEGIQEYTAALLSDWEDEISGLGFGMASRNDRGSHLFGLSMPEGIQVADARDILAAARVSVSVRGSSIRVAPHVYNDHDDMSAFVDALKKVVQQ